MPKGFDFNKYTRKLNEYFNIKIQLGTKAFDDLKLTQLRRYLISDFNAFGNQSRDYVDQEEFSISFNIIKMMLFTDEAKTRMRQLECIRDDGLWDGDRIKSLKTHEKMKKTIDYYLNAVQFLNRAKKNKNYNSYISRDVNKDAIAVLYNDLSRIYYHYNNEEDYIKYSLEAIDYGSVSCASILLFYYIDKDDYATASDLFEKCCNMRISYEKINERISVIYSYESSKLVSCTNMYNYLFNKGLYEEALFANEKARDLINCSRTIDNNDRAYIMGMVDSRDIECNKRIEEHKNAKYKANDLEKYYKQDIISMMSEDVKIYISTSINIYNYIINNAKIELDYSAALIPIMKGVENILYDIFAVKYVEFLKTLKYINYDLIVDRFKYKNKYINNRIDRIEYGDALYTIGNHDNYESKWVIRDYFKKFYQANKRDEEFESHTLELLNRLSTLKEKRNNVAHRNRIFKIDAEECIKDLIEEHINFITLLYTYFDFCFKD